jgi:RNA polymerase sigma-70 factor, ECF subfamily
MPTPVVTINRAVAVAETKGPETGLALLDGVVEELDGYHLLRASRGSMLERLGRTHEAGLEYDRAAALARTETDMSFLSRRRPSSPSITQQGLPGLPRDRPQTHRPSFRTAAARS